MHVAFSPLPHRRAFDRRLLFLLKPALNAYMLGYASSTGPRLLTLLLLQLSKRRKEVGEKDLKTFFHSLIGILKGGLEVQRFPTFCAVLVGLSTLLQTPLRTLVGHLYKEACLVLRMRHARWLSTFVAAWLSLKLLQSKPSDSSAVRLPESTEDEATPFQPAGRTLDLTLFAVTRALDVIIGEIWSQRKAHRIASRQYSKLDEAISTLVDPSIFAISSALIMWSFIYYPERLPRSYNKWIKSAGVVDQRLLIALRLHRNGDVKYGTEPGKAHILQDMCKDYGYPLSWGDPAQSIPYPCDLVHMGTGSNCEYHALVRFKRSFGWAFSTYLPLNLIYIFRNPTKHRFIHALKSSTRSSAFLATFIALFYYGVCLARTRLGPKMIGTDVEARQCIDSGHCVASGCELCGWSILIESESRRKELALFGAPRALATLLPRRYAKEKQWRENLAFAISTAVVFDFVTEKPGRVRGVFGKVLKGVLGS